MDGSTVVIGPPDGNMTSYINSLEKLSNFEIDYFAPGHGNYIYEPKKTVQSIIRHRLSREGKVLRKLEEEGKAKKSLKQAAVQNVVKLRSKTKMKTTLQLVGTGPGEAKSK